VDFIDKSKIATAECRNDIFIENRVQYGQTECFQLASQ